MHVITIPISTLHQKRIHNITLITVYHQFWTGNPYRFQLMYKRNIS